MKTFFIIFSLLLSIIMNAQSNKPDYIVNSGHDTIWCKIEMKDSSYIYYKMGEDRKMIQTTDVLSYKIYPSLIEKNISFTNEALPKISLSYNTITSTTTNSSTNQTTTHSSRNYNRFYLNGDADHLMKFGWMDKNIKKYLIKDNEAMRHERKSFKIGIINRITFVIALGSMISLAAAALSDNPKSDDNVDYSAMVFIPSFAITFWSQGSELKQLKKAVKTYNKNAGYGEVIQ